MRVIITILICLICLKAYPTNYYLDFTGGNNSNTGLSPVQAWKNLNKITSGSFSPGDSILLKRGEVWGNENFIMPNSGSAGSRIIISAYGSGNLPVVSGFTTLSSWTNESGSIYYASVSCAYDIRLFTVNGTIRWQARYPDATAPNGDGGWLTITGAGTNNTQGGINTFTLATAPPISPAGGETVLKFQQWLDGVDSCTGLSGNVTSFQNGATGNVYNPTVGAGAFYQRKKEYLTQAGEWWYDVAQSRMYYFGNPSGSTIKVATKDIGIDLNGKSYITIENLYIEGFDKYCILNDAGATNITVQNCTVNYSGKGGIDFDQVSFATVQNNYVANCLNSGIYVKRSGGVSPNALITGNTVTQICRYAGLGLYSDASPRCPITGVSGTTGGNIVITYNTVSGAGYSGIQFEGNSVLVAFNYVDSCNLTTQDGANIYTYVSNGSSPAQYSNRWVYKNILLNGIGSPQGTTNTSFFKARGIYCDEGSNHIVVDSNTVANMADFGLYNNSASTLNHRYNIVYNNGGGMSYQRFRDAGLSSQLVDTANIFYPYTFNYFDNAINQPAGTLSGRLDSFTINRNYFRVTTTAPFGLGSKNYTNTPPTGYVYNYYPLNQWQGTWGKDVNSTAITPGTVRFQYNYSSSTLNVNLSDSIFVDVTGATVQGTLQIPAYYSSLLIFTGTEPQPPLPPVGSTKWNTHGRPLRQGN